MHPSVWCLLDLGVHWFLQWVIITDKLIIFLTASSWIALRVRVYCHCINYGFCRSSKIRDLNYFSFFLEWCWLVGAHTSQSFFVQVANMSHEPDWHKHRSHICKALKQCLKCSFCFWQPAWSISLFWCDAQLLILSSSLTHLKQNLFCSLGFLICANIFDASLVLKLFCSKSWHIGN